MVSKMRPFGRNGEGIETGIGNCRRQFRIKQNKRIELYITELNPFSI